MNLEKALELSKANPDILRADLERESALFDFEPSSNVVLNSLTNLDLMDWSFTRQIHDLINGEHVKPDVFIFTAYSAVPFADMVRGYYEKSKDQTPKLGFVRTDGRVRKKRTPSGAIDTSQELCMLSETLNGARNVCIVEEYVDTGTTLDNAHKLISKLTNAKISAIRGGWDPMGVKIQETNTIDLYNMTSPKRDQLKELGRAAFELSTNF